MTRITKADLEIGMVVEDRYGRQVQVTRLDPFDDSNAPSIGPGDFGYIPDDADLDSSCVAGVSAVSNIDHIVEEA